ECGSLVGPLLGTPTDAFTSPSRTHISKALVSFEHRSIRTQPSRWPSGSRWPTADNERLPRRIHIGAPAVRGREARHSRVSHRRRQGSSAATSWLTNPSTSFSMWSTSSLVRQSAPGTSSLAHELANLSLAFVTQLRSTATPLVAALP